MAFEKLLDDAKPPVDHVYLKGIESMCINRNVYVDGKERGGGYSSLQEALVTAMSDEYGGAILDTENRRQSRSVSVDANRRLHQGIGQILIADKQTTVEEAMQLVYTVDPTDQSIRTPNWSTWARRVRRRMDIEIAYGSRTKPRRRFADGARHD